MNPDGLKALLQILTLVTVIQHRKQRPQRYRGVRNDQPPLLFDDEAINLKN